MKRVSIVVGAGVAGAVWAAGCVSSNSPAPAKSDDGGGVEPNDAGGVTPNDSGNVGSNDGGKDATSDDGATPGCTFSVSGASTGSGTCTAEVEYFPNGGQNQLEFILLNQTSTGGTFHFLSILGYNNPALLKVGTYTTANVQTSTGIWADGNNQWWENEAPALGTGGSFTLTISAIPSSTSDDAGTTVYDVHGTLVDTMPENQAMGTNEAGVANGQATF